MLPVDENDGTTLLVRAALKGDVAVVTILSIVYRHQVNWKALGGQSALHAAASAGSWPCCEALLDNGANVDQDTDRDHTALMISCSCGHAVVVSELLRRGASAKMGDREQKTCLHFAAASAPVTTVLLGHPVAQKLVGARDVNGITPLMIAVILSSKSEVVVEKLLGACRQRSKPLATEATALADPVVVNSAAKDGMSALMHASSRGLEAAVAKLLRAGADPRMRDAFGQSAMHLAAKARWPGVVRLLLAHDAIEECKPTDDSNDFEKNEADGFEEEEESEEEEDDESNAGGAAEVENKKKRRCKKPLVGLRDDDGLLPVHAVLESLSNLITSPTLSAVSTAKGTEEEQEQQHGWARTFSCLEELLEPGSSAPSPLSSPSPSSPVVQPAKAWQQQQRYLARGADFSGTTALHLLVRFASAAFSVNGNCGDGKQGAAAAGAAQAPMPPSAVPSPQTRRLSETLRDFALKLLEKGADPLAEDDSGWACLHYAWQQQQQQQQPSDGPLSALVCVLEEAVGRVALCAVDRHKTKATATGYLARRGAHHRIPKAKRDAVLRGERSLAGIARHLLHPPTDHAKSQSAPAASSSAPSKASKPRHKVVVLCGAGVSTSAGIPDYRSETGVYRVGVPAGKLGGADNDNAEGQQRKERSAKDAFSSFAEDPGGFWGVARAVFGPAVRGEVPPTPAHRFLAHLNALGMLQRVYTQNVDGLELCAGVSASKVVQCHGRADALVCGSCGQAPLDHAAALASAYPAAQPTAGGASDGKNTSSPLFVLKGTADTVATAPTCDRCLSGVLRPQVTFFGEPMPSEFSAHQDEDFREATLLVVLGTTLVVYPFASLVGRCHKLTPRLLINRELTGPFRQPNESAHAYRDVGWVGSCDEGLRELASLLEWNEDEWLSQSD